MNYSLTQIKRDLRKTWSDDEDQLASESAIYAKRRMSLIDYLINVANSNLVISISLFDTTFKGTIQEIGKNYACIKNFDIDQIYLISLPSESKIQSLSIEIKVTDEISEQNHLEVTDFDFKSRLCSYAETFTSVDLYCSSNKSYKGKMEIFKDFVSIFADTSYDTKQKLVTPFTHVIPIGNIAAISAEI